MTIPAKYAWLHRETGPKILIEALALYGTIEAAGAADNPAILGWARETGIPDYTHDAIAWCGLFVAVAAKRAGYQLPRTPLRALAWGSWGVTSAVPMLGDVLVFARPGGGHVGLYVAEDETSFHVLGGNQSDQVSVTRILRSRLQSARRSPWRVGQPENVRRILMNAAGEISSNEA